MYKVQIFEITDLDNQALGEAKGFTVSVDTNAAGLGWFVDSSPEDNHEFVGDVTMAALAGSDAENVIDLYTVLSHEIGHILGYSHNGSDSRVAALMDSQLNVGERLLIAMPQAGVWTPELDDEPPVGNTGSSGSVGVIDEDEDDGTGVDPDTGAEPSSGNGNGKGKGKK